VTLAEVLPGVNASLNATSACALFVGYWAIRTRRLSLHWKCMAAAFAASSLFLVGYLTRYALTGVHHYAGPGRAFYLVLLGTHTLLAALALPLILRTMWLSAVRRSYAAHRRIAVWTFPVWAYVSVTGVLVYIMLYRL
jgi:putative membrane protein